MASFIGKGSDADGSGYRINTDPDWLSLGRAQIMSLESWEAEFCPIAADAVATDPSATNIDLLEHSLNKWRGLRKANVVKHDGCQNDASLVFKDGKFVVSGYSCALCARYTAYQNPAMKQDRKQDCEECPLAMIRNGTQCDSQTAHEEESNIDAPYMAYVYPSGSDWGDPEPMIDWLEKALEMVKSQKEEHVERSS